MLSYLGMPLEINDCGCKKKRLKPGEVEVRGYYLRLSPDRKRILGLYCNNCHQKVSVAISKGSAKRAKATRN